MPFEDNSFDSVVDTFTLSSCFDKDAVVAEMIRVCRPGGKLLIMERGLSYWSLFNRYLQFKAARDLVEDGCVEHIDFEEFLENQRGVKLVHKERRNIGMTYVYIL